MNGNCFSCSSRKSLAVLLLLAAFAASAFAQNTSNSILPVVTIHAPDPTASESGDPGLFTLFRDGPTNLALGVYCVIEGSASNGVDYVGLPNTVTIPAGVRSVPLPVVPMDDNLIEGTETVVVRLVYPPILPPVAYIIGAHSHAVVTIADNEPPPTNQPPTITILSPANGATFTAPANIFLIASVHDPDGIAAAAAVEFFAGTNKLGNGQLFDPGPPHEAPFRFIWTNVPPGEYTLTAKVTDDHRAMAYSAPVHIIVRSVTAFPVVTVIATDPNAAEPSDPGTFTIYRSGTNALEVFYTLSGTASNGVDYFTPTPLPPWPFVNSVFIPAGAHSASVTIMPRDDNLVEGPETVVLHLEYCSDFAPCYDIGSPSTAVVTIQDNDPPPHMQPVVTIEATDAHAAEPGVLTVIDPGMFTVYRAGNTSATLYVHYHIEGTASNGLDYLAISNVVVIPAGATAARVLINPLHDNLPEGTETVVLRLEEPVCIAIFPPPPDCYRVGMPSNATVYIADNDTAPTNHPPTVHIFTPTNGASFVAPANIFIAAQAQDVDGYLTIQTVEFFAGAHSLGIRTNYPTMDPIGPFRLVWTNVPPGNYALTARATDSGGASGISPLVEIRVGGTNHPPTNVPPIVTITAPDAIASEGTNWHCWPGWTNHHPTDVCGTNTATFVVRRTGDTNTSLSVLYDIRGTASNGVDYAALPGSVTIPAGHRSAEIRIVPLDDTLPERIETVVLSLVGPPVSPTVPPPYALGQPRRAAAMIVDNDQPRPSTGMLPDRSFHIMRPGDNGTWWRIECSTNLVDWTALCTNSVTDGAIHFVDPDGAELPQRFYRALPESNPPDE